MNSECPFCTMSEDAIILRNEHAYVINDKYPDEKGHLLVVTHRHVDNFFESNSEERNAILELLDKAKDYTDEKYSPGGYKIIVNSGRAAGQIIMHLHFHLIPKYKK
jgi:diadenosine tetraphosphate (Ap4A) HIT family hydrolase